METDIILKAFKESDMTEMASTSVISHSWKNMDRDILAKIFKALNMAEMVPVSVVCHSWRLACSDPWLWKTVDLGLLTSDFIPTRASPYVWVADRSDRRLTRILRTTISLSRGHVACMIFHFNLYMRDEHLDYIAGRCPFLKRLVLPAWNRITKTGICRAIQSWPELESLTMPGIAHPSYVMEQISNHCKNFSQLKVMGNFDFNFAAAIVSFCQDLKVLSLRCSILTEDALLLILNCLERLEVLNISHCVVMDGRAISGSKTVLRKVNHRIIEKASRLRQFLDCQDGSCLTCQRMVRDEGLMRWWRYEEWFWRHDEVSSLALEDCGKLFDDRCRDKAMRD